MSNTGIIVDVAEGLGLSKDERSFDSDILIYCGIAAVQLKQVGVISYDIIHSDSTWIDLGYYDTSPKENLLPYFVLVTKLHFDPPQPSMVQTFNNTIENTLERLRVNARSYKLKEVKK